MTSNNSTVVDINILSFCPISGLFRTTISAFQPPPRGRRLTLTDDYGQSGLP